MVGDNADGAIKPASSYELGWAERLRLLLGKDPEQLASHGVTQCIFQSVIEVSGQLEGKVIPVTSPLRPARFVIAFRTTHVCVPPPTSPNG